MSSPDPTPRAPAEPVACEGYTFTGPRTVLHGTPEAPRLFVQRWAAKPSTWLRVLRKSDGTGWWVTGHKSKRAAIDDAC